MTRVCQAIIGMRVLTPRGHLAKVIGLNVDTRAVDRQGHAKTFVRLMYLSQELGEVDICASLLRGYDGPPVLFPDELSAIAGQYARARR